MKRLLTLLLASATIISAAFFTPLAGTQTTNVSLTIVDEATGKPIPGVIRVRKEDSSVVAPGGLVSRGWGLDAKAAISEWFVVPGEVTVKLPQEKLMIEAISGIESDRVITSIDLTDANSREIRIRLPRFSDRRRAGWYAANTHLHLSKLSREESDRYLREIPAADRLDVLFISHLERADDDRGYITNQYPTGRLRDLEAAGVLVSNGEEHRHNFGPQGEGYGHVMLLGIKELVQPVSIGYGISKKHPDAPPIRAGIDTAHEQGGTAIWCHNNWGFEDVPNWLAGKLDAQNIFDGGSHGGYEDSFYRYLNAGLRVPFSTGTDWFMYDFSRVYARVDGELSPESWLAALRAGRTFITNGPLLEFRVNDSGPGDTIALDQPAALEISASAVGRLDFDRLEVIQNGRVIETVPTRPVDGHYAARLRVKLPVSEPGWIAARISPSAKTEYGNPLFAHTSAVYTTVGGRRIQIETDVRFLLGQLESARSAIAANARFETDSQREAVLSAYDRATSDLRDKLAK
jgi:hypothetical protein